MAGPLEGRTVALLLAQEGVEELAEGAHRVARAGAPA